MAARLGLRGFELRVKGYEFPGASALSSVYDANWLVADARIRTPQGGLEFADEACLLTWELRDLAGQLEALGAPQQHGRWQAELKPLEPYVSLRFLEDETGLFFAAEFTVYGDDTIQSHKVQWRITRQELEAFRQQLHQLLEAFPVKEQL